MEIKNDSLVNYNLTDYKLIDYRTWVLGDEARKGINLKRLDMLDIEEVEMWDIALPFLDLRNDAGHTEFAGYKALKLLDYLPGNRKIVSPAILLHDTGWYGNDPEAWKKLVASTTDLKTLESEATRRPHQNRGCLIAGMILEKTGYLSKYPKEYFLEIADIIGDHDTRKLPTTDNGRIVRAADYLWRVSYPCMEIYMKDSDAETTLKRIEESSLENQPPHRLEGIEREIAKIELVNSMFFKFKSEAVELLKSKYPGELERVIEFYS